MRPAKLLLIALLLTGCSNDDERFLDTYTAILIARMSITDTARANEEVQRALQQHGYTEAEFRQAFLERAQDPERLRALVDSARARAQRQLQMKSQHRTSQ